MKYGKSELIRRLTDMVRNGWNNNAVRDLIESLWRDPFSHRTSGFVEAGGGDSLIGAEVITELVEGVMVYKIRFSIAPRTKKFHFYQLREILSYHKKYALEEITFDALEGLHSVYYDFDELTNEQVLKHTWQPDRNDLSTLFEWMVPVAFIYFDAGSREIIYFGDNRHGSLWNPWMHFSWHRTFNSMREHGLQFTGIQADEDGSLDSHARFGITAGACFHEDIYQQSPGVATPAALPVFWFSADGPRIHPGSVESLVNDGLLCFNDWEIIRSASEKHFVMLHVFYTNCIYHPFIAVIGQSQYEKIGMASLSVSGEVTRVRELLPHQNLLHIGTLLYQTSVEYTNRSKARVVSQVVTVETAMSVTGEGSREKPVVLVNDKVLVDPYHYYGTDQLGEKGFHPLPSSFIIEQPSHGFIVGDAIRMEGAQYALALADNDHNAQVCGIVSEVLDPDRFRYAVDGFIPGSWTPGAEYFLSPVLPGKLITLPDPEIWQIGQVRISLGWGITQGLKVEIDVGDVISESVEGVYTQMSVVGNGFETNKIRLKGDVESPAPTNYYGTNHLGQHSYHPLPFEAVQLLFDSTPLFDLELGRGARITLSSDSVITFSNLQANDTGHIEVTQDALGGHNLSFAGAPVIRIAQNSYRVPGSVRLTGVAGSRDVVAYWWTGEVLHLAVIYNMSL